MRACVLMSVHVHALFFVYLFVVFCTVGFSSCSRLVLLLCIFSYFKTCSFNCRIPFPSCTKVNWLTRKPYVRYLLYLDLLLVAYLFGELYRCFWNSEVSTIRNKINIPPELPEDHATDPGRDHDKFHINQENERYPKHLRCVLMNTVPRGITLFLWKVLSPARVLWVFTAHIKSYQETSWSNNHHQ